MIKTYQQFYSMMNDPILKAAYEKQMEQSFGAETEINKNVKQRLEGLSSLPYPPDQKLRKVCEIVDQICHRGDEEKYIKSNILWVIDYVLSIIY